MVRNPSANAREVKRHGFGKMPWRRTWQPTPIFLPGESHGKRSLVGYSPSGQIELDTMDMTKYACKL